MQSLTLSDAQNLRVCAARRAVQAIGVSLYRCIREEESCTLWAGIAETIRAQTQASSATFHLLEPDPVGDLKSF
jgi:hypothetical protein